MKTKKEILPIEKDKKQASETEGSRAKPENKEIASEIKREQKDFEKLFEKCVNTGVNSQIKKLK